MRYLITGGSGFIGTHMVKSLVQHAHVTSLDLKPSPVIHGAFTDIRGDVRHSWVVNSLVERADCVIHLASKVGAWHYIDETRDTYTTIIDGTANVVDACVTHNVPLLMLSTSEVYGKTSDVPMRESGDLVYGSTDKTRWVYGMAKGIAEHIALTAHRNHDLHVTIVRPFNVVGPGQSAEGGLVFPSFAQQVVNDGVITIHGDGSQTRSFVHIRDFIAGCFDLMRTPDANGAVINLGGNHEISINRLAAMFQEIAHDAYRIDVETQYVPHSAVYPVGYEDTPRRQPHLRRANELIGWHDRTRTPIAVAISDVLAEAIEQREQQQVRRLQRSELV